MGTEKETTAPIPSVAPDGEQPFALTRNDSIPFTEEKNKSSGGMTVIPMPKLMEIRFPVKPAVIEGLLPVGTYLLAGAPRSASPSSFCRWLIGSAQAVHFSTVPSTQAQCST